MAAPFRKLTGARPGVRNTPDKDRERMEYELSLLLASYVPASGEAEG
jgi:hypothetical protein